MKKQLITLALLTGFSNLASAAVLPNCDVSGNLINNCSFEDVGTSTEGFNGNTFVADSTNPPTTLNGWLFSSTSGATLPDWADVNAGTDPYYAEVRDNTHGTGTAAAGTRYLELDTHYSGTDSYNGSIVQSVGLLANTEYTFSFNWAKRVGQSSTVSDGFSVSAFNGSTTQSFSTAGLVDLNGDHNWQDFTTTFTTVAAGNYDFSFIGEGAANAFGASIDNVSLSAVAAVPEPETYAMLLMGLGLLGFAARKQKS